MHESTPLDPWIPDDRDRTIEHCECGARFDADHMHECDETDVDGDEDGGSL